MTALARRLRRRVDARDDTGSALALALVFLMLFGIYVGVVLSFAQTSLRSTAAVRDEGATTYAAGGAVDGAINAVRTDLTAGVDPGTTPIPATSCFSLPAGQLGNTAPVTVTCRPRPGSGAGATGSLRSQPAQAVLTTATNAAEGISVPTGANVRVQGSALAQQALTVPLGATLTSSTSIAASTCAVLGTATPTPQCGAAIPPDPASDPAAFPTTWAGPTTYPTPVGTLPACATPVVRLSPGTYQSRTALQAVLNCPNTVIWFRPGQYYFDFTDAGTHELTFDTASSVVVGGTERGWTPGTTAAGSVPRPTAASPQTSACDRSAAGVELVFGGDSRMTVRSGSVQLCALEPSTTTTKQHVVVRGLSSTTTVPGSTTGAVTGSTDTGAATSRKWLNPQNATVVDGSYAYAKMPNRNDPPSILTMPVSSPVVPAGATVTSVRADVTEALAGTGNMTVRLTPGNGGAPTARLMLRDCPVTAPCTNNGQQTDSLTHTGFTTAAQVNGMSLELLLDNPNNSPVEAWVDGVTVTVSFTAPMRAVSGSSTVAPYVVGSAATTPLLAASGAWSATSQLALQGTVYAPTAVVDLAQTGVPHVVVDRGVVARHAALRMTPAGGYSGPLISVPPTVQSPRRVLFTATDASGTVLLSSEVVFADGSGGANGTIPAVQTWSVR